MDLFIGPYVGREISTGRLCSLVEDIGSPQHFQSSQPVLAVKSRSGPTKGFLMILGGGEHRFMSSSRVLHGNVIPYKLVNFSDVLDGSEQLEIIQYKGIIAFEVEANEPREERYGLMEQVLLYGDLKEYWKRLEGERVSRLKGRKAILRKISHNKIYRLYEETAELVGLKSRWAIEFLSGKDSKLVRISPATRRQYMSGADRLLDAGVVPCLSSLEQDRVAAFNRGSLYAVRNWSVEKIRKAVDLWKVRQSTGVKVKYHFSDKVGRDVDGKGRGRKPSQATLGTSGEGDDPLVALSPGSGVQAVGGDPNVQKPMQSDTPDPPSNVEDQNTSPCTQSEGLEVKGNGGSSEKVKEDLGKRSGLEELMSRLDQCVGPSQEEHTEITAECGKSCTGETKPEETHGSPVNKMEVLSMLHENDTTEAEHAYGASGERSIIGSGADEESNDVLTPLCAQGPPIASKRDDNTRTSLVVVDELLCELDEQKSGLGDVVCDIDVETDIQIAKKVKERLCEETGILEVPMQQLWHDSAMELEEIERRDIKLVTAGGVLGVKFTLCETDLKPIRKFHIGNDRSVMFTISFLTKWTAEGVKVSTLHDSVWTLGGGMLHLPRISPNF